MKEKNERITALCAFCEHAILSPKNIDGGIPALVTIKADVFDEDAILLTCPYHKEAAPDFSCRRFSFDPLKYRPKKAPSITTLDEESLLLD